MPDMKYRLDESVRVGGESKSIRKGSGEAGYLRTGEAVCDTFVSSRKCLTINSGLSDASPRAELEQAGFEVVDDFRGRINGS